MPLKSTSVKGNIDFSEWLGRCDNAMMYEIGVYTEEYPSIPWKEYYEEGLTPSEAVDRVAKIEKLDLESDKELED